MQVSHYLCSYPWGKQAALAVTSVVVFSFCSSQWGIPFVVADGVTHCMLLRGISLYTAKGYDTSYAAKWEVLQGSNPTSGFKIFPSCCPHESSSEPMFPQGEGQASAGLPTNAWPAA